MNYWTVVQMDLEELEELAETDLSSSLAAKVRRHLDAMRESLEGLENAHRVSERLAWNAEMNRLIGGGGGC